ncbi:MAG: hypothetical protein LBR11_03255 [Deltaproteobacteria bacterium]|nr:hypothetical protein [Deltaproteobacteria bacterium]
MATETPISTYFDQLPSQVFLHILLMRVAEAHQKIEVWVREMQFLNLGLFEMMIVIYKIFKF